MKWFHRFLCWLFGHRAVVVHSHDNGRSVIGYLLCPRCGEDIPYQYDY